MTAAMENGMTGGTEKRKYLRLSAMGPVEVVVQGGATKGAYLASIGRGGLGLYLHEVVRPGQLVLVSLRLLVQQGDPEELKVGVRTRWARNIGSLWMAGFAFEQMSDARYASLLRHLHIIESWQLGDRLSEDPATRIRFTVKE